MKEEREEEKILNPDAPKNISRRLIDFLLGFSIVGLVTSMVYPIVRYMSPPQIPEPVESKVLAAKRGELAPNSGKVFAFGRDPAILIRKPNGDYAAFTAICTHLSCTVQYRSDLQLIWCACHNGRYDLNGINTSGPPPRPLQPYQVKLQGQDIWVLKNA